MIIRTEGGSCDAPARSSTISSEELEVGVQLAFRSRLVERMRLNGLSTS